MLWELPENATYTSILSRNFSKNILHRPYTFHQTYIFLILKKIIKVSLKYILKFYILVTKRLRTHVYRNSHQQNAVFYYIEVLWRISKFTLYIGKSFISMLNIYNFYVHYINNYVNFTHSHLIQITSFEILLLKIHIFISNFKTTSIRHKLQSFPITLTCRRAFRVNPLAGLTC